MTSITLLCSTNFTINKLVEMKNRSLGEPVRTMHNETNIPKYLWDDVVNIAFYVMNKVLITPFLKITP